MVRSTGPSRGSPYVIAGAILWGTTGTALALGPESADPVGVGSLRMVLGGLALVILAVSAGSSPFRSDWPVAPTVFAAASMAAYQPLFFAAVIRTGVAVGTLVAIGSAPLLAAVGARIVRNERLDRRWGIATAVAIGGLGLLVAGGGTHVDSTGILLAVGAGMAYAAYAVAAKDLLEERAPLAVMAWIFGWAGLASAPALAFADREWLAEPGGWALILHLGLVTTAIAYGLFAKGLKTIKVSAATTLTLAEPATAALLALFVLGETLAPAAWAGIALIGTGLTVVAWPGSRRRLHTGSV